MRSSRRARAGSVAHEDPLGEQVVGRHRARGTPARRGRRTGPARAARAERPAANRWGTVGPHDERPVAEVVGDGAGRRHGVVDVAEDARPAGAPWTAARVSTPTRSAARRRPSTTPAEPAGGRARPRPRRPGSVDAPAQGGRARLHRVVGLAAEHRVDDEALEPGVPGAAGLGGVRVDLGGRERDLARVAQHRLAQCLLLAGLGQRGRVLLDDVDDRPDEVEGLAQGDRAGQLARGGAEDVGRDRSLVTAVAQPAR